MTCQISKHIGLVLGLARIGKKEIAVKSGAVLKDCAAFA